MGTLTIFRGAAIESDDDALRYAAEDLGASVENVGIAALRARVLSSLATGAVVLVAADDRMATIGLAAGADEILRAGEVTRAALRNAVERAGVRAVARSSPEFRRALFDEEASLAFLLSAFTDQLREPLACASFELEILNSSLPSVFDVGDELATWAALAAPVEEVRRLVGRRLAAPASAELGNNLRRLGSSLARARRVSGILEDLVSPADTIGVVDCGRLMSDLVDVLRREVAPTASLEVEAEPLCRTTLPKSFVALLGVSLIVRSMNGVRAASRPMGEIRLKVHEAEGTVVIEVADNGAFSRTDLRPNVLEGSMLDTNSSERRGLASLRDRLRNWGGELLVDSDENGTTVRALLPTAAEQPLPEANARVQTRVTSQLPD
jgi:hypothetical protein